MNRRYVFVVSLLLVFLAASLSQNVSAEQPDLLVPFDGGPPDQWLGANDAPVTIIEYASMTCPHCAQFHAVSLPYLVENYISRGSVRYALRELPLDPVAMAGAMVARCAGPSRMSMIGLLFDQQKAWAFAAKKLEGLIHVSAQAGMSEARVRACLDDAVLYDQIVKSSEAARTAFGIQATPTIFINGKKYEGALTPEELARAIPNR